MTSDRRLQSIRIALSPLLLVALTIAALPAASATAQSPQTSLDEAYAFLGAVPGLKVEQLNVFSDAIGDVDGADATWGASGKIDFSNKLRKWLKGIVESEYGWGRLPGKDAELLTTFIGLADSASLGGEQTAVLHTGLAGEGDVTLPGLQQDPAAGVRLLHSGGLWFRDGQFYPQNGTSPVSVGGVAWFGEAAKGAGGIVQPDGVIVNVVPVPKWTRHYRLTVEGSKPFSDPPAPPTRDVVYAPGGSQLFGFEVLPGLGSVACVSTFVSPLPDGRRQVQLDIQASEEVAPEDLAELRLSGYTSSGAMGGSLDGGWTTIPGIGHRGLFVVDDFGVDSVAIAPDGAADGLGSAITRANAGRRIGLNGMGLATGMNGCGQLVSDVDACDARVLEAMSSTAVFDGLGTSLRGVAGISPDGAVVCDIFADERPVGRLLNGMQPVVSQGEVQIIAEASGCDTFASSSLPDGAVISCDGFAALLWRSAIPASATAPFDGSLGIIGSILLYRPVGVSTGDATADSADFGAAPDHGTGGRSHDRGPGGADFRLAVPQLGLPD